MKETLRLIIVLSVICTVAGVLLGIVNNVTDAPIRKAEADKHKKAIEEVLPASAITVDNPPETCYVVDDTGTTNTYYVARQDGKFLGCAMEASSRNGYGGEIRLMVGVTHNGTLHGIYILKQQETPGLGAKIDTPDFQSQLHGLSIQDTSWKVEKDGGDIEAITAATISSRAVTEAIRDALKRYEKDHPELIQSEARPPENPAQLPAR